MEGNNELIVKETCCNFNCAINCPKNDRKCDKCGWNPIVSAKRKENIQKG